MNTRVRAETRNITLALPRLLLRRAKLLAVKRDTSVSGLLCRFLEELVRRDTEYERARRRALRELKRPASLGTRGRASWTRDQLHERG